MQSIEGLLCHVRDTPPALRAEFDATIPACDDDDDILFASQLEQSLETGTRAAFAAVMRTGADGSASAICPDEMGSAFEGRGCGESVEEGGEMVGVVEMVGVCDEHGRVEGARGRDGDGVATDDGEQHCTDDVCSPEMGECGRACKAGFVPVITCASPHRAMRERCCVWAGHG